MSEVPDFVPNEEQQDNKSEEEKANEINRNNEAEDIQKMVEEGLLTKQEVQDFSYDNEAEKGKSMFKTLPRVSERMKTHIARKFNPAIEEENDQFLEIHGTSFNATYSLWHGLGQNIVGQYGQYLNPRMSWRWYDDSHRDQTKQSKGKFYLKGMTESFTKRFGFNINPKTGFRRLSESKFPIHLVGLYIQKPRAIVLAFYEEQRIESIIGILNQKIKELQNQNDGKKEEHKDVRIPNYIYGEIIPEITEKLRESEHRRRIAGELLENYKIELETKLGQINPAGRIIGTGTYSRFVTAYNEAQELRAEFITKVEKIHRLADSDIEKDRDELTKNIFIDHISKLSHEERIKYVKRYVKKLEELQHKNRGDQLYNWSYDATTSDRLRLFTKNEMVNYLANTMVTGVDRSKIIPIFDWDGNMLWPKEVSMEELQEMKQQEQEGDNT